MIYANSDFPCRPLGRYSFSICPQTETDRLYSVAEDSAAVVSVSEGVVAVLPLCIWKP